MELQNSQVTDKTLELKKLEVMQSLITKWNGVMPNTVAGDGLNALLNIGK